MILTRKEIEQKFVNFEGNGGRGPTLCRFIALNLPEFKHVWDSIWHDSEHNTITQHFKISGGYLAEGCTEQAYMCRALTLNMFLDDNNINYVFRR